MNHLAKAVLLAGVALAGVLRTNAQPVTTIYSFTHGPATPLAGLTLGQNGNFYGTTSTGGGNNLGTVFEVTTNGTLTTLANFNGYGNGSGPEANLTLGPDGNFYGTTAFGGTNLNGNDDTGTVFKLTTNGTVTTLVNFNGPNGGIPLAGLTLGPDGDYYGTTEFGGSNSDGTVFKLTTNGTLTTLVNFNTTNGANPLAGLAAGPNGTFYGTTRYGGGTNGLGTVFAVRTNGTFTSLISFGGTNGAWPYGGVIVGPDGNLYGTTAFGGEPNGNFSDGSIFELTTNGVLTTLVRLADFSGTNGSEPYAGLTLGPDGNFYGTTFAGGAHGNGAVFQVSTNGTLAMLARIPGITVQTIYNSQGYEFYTTNNFNTIAPVENGTIALLYSFSAPTNYINADGVQPQSTVVFGPDNLLYGTASGGGTNGYGTVFKMTTNGTFSTLASFSGNDGDNPMAAVTPGPNGSLYGTANTGGTASYGTIFKITAGGAVTTVVNFDRANYGANPQASLTVGPGGNFFGTAAGGGDGLLYIGNNTYDAVSDGTAFELTTNGVFTTLTDFNGTNGANPYGGLAVGLDGNLYGTTTYGGISNDGAIFMLQTNGTLTSLTNFVGGNGANPFATLTLGLDGNFYGTCEAGGSNGPGIFLQAGAGTVFQVKTNGALTTLVYFNGTNGASPNDGLLLGPDGNFYGTTFEGGTGNYGTVFKVTPGGTLTTLATFAQTNGEYPVGGLALGPDGYFYGTTDIGGVLENAGTVFKLATNGTLTTLYDFVYSPMSPNGNYPFASLTLITNGNFMHFYGTTMNGGSGGGGTVFRLDLTTAYTVTENSTNTFFPLTNDTIWAVAGTLGLMSATATNGTAQISGSGITFTPAANFTGMAAINYTVTDNAGGTNHSLITVLVTNIPPVANPDFYTVAENSSANVFSPLTNDMPVTSGGTLSIVSVSPTNGTAAISGTNVLFTPQAGFLGTATIGYTITDNIGGTNSAVITVTVVSLSADLSLNVSAAPEPVEVGSNLVYSITVSNAGPSAATGVVVSNQIPAGVTFVSASGGATPSGGVLFVSLGSLAVGATNLVQVVIEPNSGGTLTNFFQVFANENDPELANNSATVLSTITMPALPRVVLYNVFDLGGLGSNTFALAVNNLGEIAGYSQSGSEEFPVFWTDHLSPISTLSQNGVSLHANYLNNSGQIVGGEVNQTSFASFWTNSSSPVLFLNTSGATRSVAGGINNLGQIVGQFTSISAGNNLPSFWTNASSLVVGLSYLGGANGSGVASAINDSGQIVGETGVTSTGRHATFWTNSASLPLDLGTLGGSKSGALSINTAGQVVGYAYESGNFYRAAFWTNSASPPMALGLLDGTTNIAASINNVGQIVGAAGTSGNPLGTAASIWTDHTSPAQDLNNLIPTNSGWILIAASCINDMGEIVGFGIITNEGVLQAHAFALIPVNAPTNADLSLSANAMFVTNSDAGGSNLVYSITVSNAGPAVATSVVVSNQIPNLFDFISATDGAQETNGVLLIPVGSLGVGATDLVQIVVQQPGNTEGTIEITNVFEAFADQPDPNPANNTATVTLTYTSGAATFFTTSTRTIDTNLTSSVSQQDTNYTTELIAVMPGGTVVYSQTLTVPFSDPSVQAAVMTAAEDLTNSGASSYIGPSKTSSVQNLQGVSSLTTTNPIGTNITAVTTAYTGPTNIFVGPNQSQELTLTAGQDDLDTLITSEVTNQVVTTNTSTYTNAAVYMMTGIVTQASANLNLTANATPEPVGSFRNLTYSITVSNGFVPVAGFRSHTPAGIATDVTLSNQIPANVLFISATGGATPTNGVLLINLGTLAEGATDDAQIVVEPLDTGDLTNSFTVLADQANVAPTNTVTVVSTVTNTVLPVVDLSIAATAAPEPVDEGSNLTYSIIVSNLVTAVPALETHALTLSATDITVSNRIPAGVTFVSATGGATPTNGLLLMNLGSLAGGQNIPAQIVVRPNVTGKLTNQFMVYCDETDSAPDNNLATVVSTVTNPPPVTVDVALTIVAVPNPVGVGAALTYSLTVTNNSPNTASGVIVSNTLPPGVTFNSALPSQGLATNKGNLVTYDVGSLPNGVAATLTMVVIPNAAGLLTNTAIAYSTQTDSVPGNNLATVVSTVTNPPPATVDVALTIVAMPNPVGVGTALTYSLTVTNNSPNTASGVVVTNTLPPGVTFNSALPSQGLATNKGNLVTYDVGSLPNGVAATLAMVVIPNAAGLLTNTATAYSTQTDSVPGNNFAAVVSMVTNPPPATVDVALTIVAVPNPVDAGTALTYSLTVTNNSPNTATGVVVSNTLPPGVTFNSALPSQGLATNKGNLVTYNVGSLPNGVAATLAMVVIPNAAGLLTNTATVYSTQTDSVPGNNLATNITTAVSVPITNLVATVLSGITLNKQTGLYEQSVEVANGGPNTPASVLLLVNGLTGGATLYNATGKTNGVPYVQSAGPLAVGSNFVFLLEYYVPSRVMPTNLRFTVEAGPPVNPPVITGTVMSISRTVGLPNGDILVEFAAIPGRIYAVQYSSDMMTWQTAVPVITAPANRVQWIDAGPPQTISSPATTPARYYRVVLLP